jgi:hypothetical protein
MKSHLANEKATDCRQPKIPGGWFSCAAGRALIALTGVLSLSIWVGPGIARGQSPGSPCLAAPTLAMAGTRVVNVATEAQLQNAMSNLRAGDTIVLANGTYNLTSTLYVNGNDNVTIRANPWCDQIV